MKDCAKVQRALAAGCAFAVATCAIADCGDKWLPQAPGPASSVFALTAADVGDGAATYAGGSFASAGGLSANRIAYWNNVEGGWRNMGTGMSDPAIAEVYSIRPFNGDIIAGGQFTFAGGQSANRIARWDGFAWWPLGAGVTGAVWALEEFEGDLVAGGFFKAAGGNPAQRVARWDGTSWHAMGPAGSDGMNGPVFALAKYKGELMAGGDFTTAGGTPANYIARWDGEQWSPLGAGVDNAVRAMIVHEGRLIAGGRFTNAGGVEAKMIAAWDGEAWSALGQGFAGGFIAPAVEALASFKGNIIAGGNFTTSGDGDTAFSRIGRWDAPAGQWRPLGLGVNSTVWALAVYNDELHLGGYLTSVVGGPAMPYWGRWDIANAPSITQHPVDAAASAGTHVVLTIEAQGFDLAYQWRRGGVTLLDDDRISGADTATLTIDPVETSDSGLYDVVVASPCGTVVSEQATLTVSAAPGVPGDLNGDGSVGVPDLLILLSEWGPCSNCDECPADLTGDCSIGVTDLLILLANWG